MRLLVRVVEARGLPAADAGDGLRDTYARSRLGKQRAKTRVARRTLSPAWDEEFAFRVGDLRDQLLVAVIQEDRYFADDVLGQVKVPLSEVLDADNRTLGTQWYQLQLKSRKSKIKECGNAFPSQFIQFALFWYLPHDHSVLRVVSYENFMLVYFSFEMDTQWFQFPNNARIRSVY
jgi:Ca2+-dependent lipid-binding protein